MGIPILFGWGKKAKEVGYIGIQKCHNCKNYAHFKLYELANNVNLYFVPVAKWNKKLYLVCSVCEAAYELDDESKEIFVEKSLNMPSSKVVDALWDEVGVIVNEEIEKYEKDSGFTEFVINKSKKKLSDRYSDEELIEEVVCKYIQCSIDQDKAK